MSFDQITSDIPPLAPADDLRHVLRAETLCRESLVFTLQLPAEGIAGWVYPRVGADGLAAGIFAVFGAGVPGGAIYETFHDVPVASTMDFDAWQVSGLEIQLTQALQKAHVKYSGQRLSYDFNFDAIHPAYSYDSHPDLCPKFFADNRFEQSGRVKGSLTIDGRIIIFDALGQRDHSWGTRNWGVNYHYKWFHATTPHSAVHFFKMEYLGRSLTRGYVFKDGHFSQISTVDVIDFTLNAEMVHTDIELIAHDNAGRSTKVNGKSFAFQPLPVDEMNVLHEVPMHIEIDGKSGTGWCEMHWDTRYLAHMKQFPQLRR